MLLHKPLLNYLVGVTVGNTVLQRGLLTIRWGSRRTVPSKRKKAPNFLSILRGGDKWSKGAEGAVENALLLSLLPCGDAQRSRGLRAKGARGAVI
jgi:hypothetical protein